MKLGISAFVLCMAAATVAQAASSPLMGPVHAFIDNFNKGDVKAAGRAYAADVSIIDEPPPHVWRGPTAFMDWAASLQKDAKAGGLTNENVTVGVPIRADINGERGYLVVPATFRYADHGKAMVESAQMVFGLVKVGDAWKIASWAWAGSKPHSAAPH